MAFELKNWRVLIASALLWVGIGAALSTPEKESEPDSSAVARETPSTPQSDSNDHLLGDWWGLRPRAEAQGISWNISYVGEMLANVSGGQRQGTIYEGLLKAAFDMDLSRALGWNEGRFHVSGLYPHGNSLSAECLGDLFILSNIDTQDTPRLFELWFEQGWRDHEFSLRLGQLAADEEFASTEYGCLFINGTCGWPGFIALNAPSPAYPVAAPGGRLAWSPNNRWTFRLAAFDGYPGAIGDQGQSINPHGIPFQFSHAALVIGEGERRWNQGAEAGLPGFIKLGTWWHSGTFDHLCTDDRGHSLADPQSSHVPQKINGNWGGYLAAQQALWRPKDTKDAKDSGLGAFFRAGLSPSDRNLIQAYAESGLTFTGLLPGRPLDQFGFATVVGKLSDELERLSRDQCSYRRTSLPRPDFEMVVEGAYRIMIRAGCSLQPCVEYLIHPGGSPATENALVLGLRACFDL